MLLNVGTGVSVVSGDAVVIRADGSGNPVTAYVEASGDDSGSPITAYKLGADREDFIANDKYLAAFDGATWYAETGPLTKSSRLPTSLRRPRSTVTTTHRRSIGPTG